MYGLSQAGILENNKLTAHLAIRGYVPTPHTPGLWKHVSKNTKFSLCVDDFLIKHTDDKDAHHLLDTLRQVYTISTDWTASLYCGVTLD